MISYDYIRGLVEGEGTFTFSTNHKERRKVPAFSIRMHVRDKQLLDEICNSLDLRNKIYVYEQNRNDGYHRAPQATLIVREFDQLKDIIVPFFYKKLHGHKGEQFDEWLEKIWRDVDVPPLYKYIYKLHQWGRYSGNLKYEEKLCPRCSKLYSE